MFKKSHPISVEQRDGDAHQSENVEERQGVQDTWLVLDLRHQVVRDVTIVYEAVVNQTGRLRGSRRALRYSEVEVRFRLEV